VIRCQNDYVLAFRTPNRFYTITKAGVGSLGLFNCFNLLQYISTTNISLLYCAIGLQFDMQSENPSIFNLNNLKFQHLRPDLFLEPNIIRPLHNPLSKSDKSYSAVRAYAIPCYQHDLYYHSHGVLLCCCLHTIIYYELCIHLASIFTLPFNRLSDRLHINLPPTS
jgi:hypothetical protein